MDARRGGIAELARKASLAAACVTFALSASGQPLPLPLPFSDLEDGVSCSFYDVGLQLLWPGSRPGWTDATGKPNGDKAFAELRLEPSDNRLVQQIDVTNIVAAWWLGRLPADGLMLRLQFGHVFTAHSREAADPALRPQLRLHSADGRRRFVEVAADATLDCSTYRGQGQLPTLVAMSHSSPVLRFDLVAARRSMPAPPVKAELVLVRAVGAPQGLVNLQVFALRAPFGEPQPLHSDGIAARYPRDQGIGNDPDVLFNDRFETRRVDARWAPGMGAPYDIVEEDPKRQFDPLDGRALRVKIPRGGALGLDLRYRFRDHHAKEPEEAYFRYHLRLAPDWLQAADGGKLPGFAGTYGRAGWGGRRWDGQAGWSLRGLYGRPPPLERATHGRVLIGTYAYHAKSDAYGEGVYWIGSGLAGLIQPGQWYAIEQHLKLNTPGREDGVLQVWIDGRLAFSREDLRLRDRPEIRIEEVWMNVFHGGTAVAPADLHLFIDSVVVARRYIGPMQR